MYIPPPPSTTLGVLNKLCLLEFLAYISAILTGMPQLDFWVLCSLSVSVLFSFVLIHLKCRLLYSISIVLFWIFRWGGGRVFEAGKMLKKIHFADQCIPGVSTAGSLLLTSLSCSRIIWHDRSPNCIAMLQTCVATTYGHSSCHDLRRSFLALIQIRTEHDLWFECECKPWLQLRDFV